MLTGPGATIGKARKLRRSMTLPEVLLWRELRGRPGGFKFRRQHPAGPFILDFACLEARLAIEVDGEAHDRESVAVRDAARDEWLMAQGYRTLRIAAQDILHNMDGAVAYILAQCQPLHRPSGGPPPRAGEDF
jgi:very-short-patch-repair endonuclease